MDVVYVHVVEYVVHVFQGDVSFAQEWGDAREEVSVGGGDGFKCR